jgi:integrase
MVTLRRDDEGNYIARKRLPDDVREEYGRLHGARHEAKFFAPKNTKSHEATKRYGEWIAEVETRIEAIRAARDGTGLSLTPHQSRKLAADWYDWFVAEHSTATPIQIEHWCDEITETIQSGGVSEYEYEHFDDLWHERPDLRDLVRPVVADVGDTEQFLAAKRLTLKEDTRRHFLDWLYADLSAALKLLMRRCGGDYRDDTYRERFPKTAEGADSGLTPWELFEKWVAERKPAYGTFESWRYVFAALAEQFKDRSAGSIMPEEAAAWIKGLISPERSAGTVKKTWLNATKTVFGWALEHKHISRNAFADVKVTVPKKTKVRETRAFRPQEARLILQAASAITDTRRPTAAAKRWVPWLCAYTGARAGEMTQLRKLDVIEEDGIHAVRITPEAGTVKGGTARVVPLHEHIIEQGFLEFVASHRDGPLFYEPDTSAKTGDLMKRKKPRYSQARQRIADWVRELGVTDENIAPNHAWRHLFKQIGRKARISDAVLDDICGHAPASVGAEYGRGDLEGMAEALKQFPRYTLKGT